VATSGQLVEAVRELPRQWWLVALRGLAAITFGILAFIWPAITLEVLILFFGAYAMVDGVLALYAAIRSRGQRAWVSVMEGIVGIGAGLVAFFSPGITALALLILIAGWAIVTGVMEVIAAVELRRVVRNEWFLILSGLLSVVFGIVLLIQPAAGALALVWLIGAYAIVFGIGMLGLSWRLRALKERLPQASAHAAHARPA
jgi:uncharacterized membrane protein HdeD (DUF308 family)